ncbi:unnamed protein product, partial [Polarella glacialis]
MPRFEVIWSKGISYRTAPILEAKALDRIPARKGDLVNGEAADDWVKTDEGLYLPLRSPNGDPLLKRKPEIVPWQGLDDNSAALDTTNKEAPWGALPPRPPPGGPGPGPGGLSEMDAFHQKYDKKYGAPRRLAAPVSALGPMATSHVRANEYMQEFRQGLEEMGTDTRDDPYLNAYAP